MGKKEKGDGENIKVAVRVRPLFSKEKERGEKTCVECNVADNQVVVKGEAGNPYQWTFDYVFNPVFTQNDIFLQVIHPMIESILEGFNATIFAYGQSGSGKTHTMSGVLGDDKEEGIIPRSFHYIFGKLKDAPPSQTFRIFCSFLELYNGKCRDLLSETQVSLAIREAQDKSFFVQDLNLVEVKFEKELFHHMEEGTDRRCVTATDLNAHSSRSHSVFTVLLEQTDSSEDGDCKVVTSKLNLVDLAGSERQSKTNASGDTLKEGANINLSLSSLGTVIDSIVKGKGHVPFRSSPLTMLLKDSLGGGSKTVMFANIRPSDCDISETVSTLRFADRAKQIKNKPKVQMDPKDQKIAELMEIIDGLKQRLKKYEGDGEPVDEEEEKEQENLKERVGQLELDLEQATSEAQRLTTEMEQLKAAGEKKEEEATAASATREESLLTAQQEKALVEQKLADEQSQHHELQRLVLEFITDMSSKNQELLQGQAPLESGNYDVTRVSKLLDTIRERAEDGLGGVSKDKLEEAVTAAVAEQRTKFEQSEQKREESHKQEVERISALNEQAQNALNQSMNRLVKMKEKIEKEKTKAKETGEEHKKEVEQLQFKQKEEVASLKGVIENLEAQLQKQQQLAVDLQRQVAMQRVDNARLEGSVRLDSSVRFNARRTSDPQNAKAAAVVHQKEQEGKQLEEEYEDVRHQYERHEQELLEKIQKMEEEKAQLAAQATPREPGAAQEAEGAEEAPADAPAGTDVKEELGAKEAETAKLRQELQKLKGQFGKDKERLLGRIDVLKKEVATSSKQATAQSSKPKADDDREHGARDTPTPTQDPDSGGPPIQSRKRRASSKASNPPTSLSPSTLDTGAEEEPEEDPVDGGTPRSARRRPSRAPADPSALEEEPEEATTESRPGSAASTGSSGKKKSESKELKKKESKKKSSSDAPKEEPKEDGDGGAADDTTPAEEGDEQPKGTKSPPPPIDVAADRTPPVEGEGTEKAATPGRKAPAGDNPVLTATADTESVGVGCDAGPSEPTIQGIPEEEHQAVVKEAEELKKELDGLRLEAEQSRTDVEAMGTENEALRAEFETARAEADEKTLESQRLAGELEHQKREYEWVQQREAEALAKVETQAKQLERERAEWGEEKEELEQELEHGRTELLAEVQKGSALNQEQIKLVRNIEELQQTIQGRDREKEALDETIEQMKRNFADQEERMANHSQIEEQLKSKFSLQLQRLEGKLEEKANVLENNRKVLQTQQELLEKKKDKEAEMERKVEDLRMERQSQDDMHREAIAEMADKMTKQSNKRIEEVVLRHRQQLQKEQKEKEKMNKKLAKEKTKVDKVKERYDQQMVLYREIEGQLEIMKEKEMQRVVGYDEVKAAQDDINKVLREKGAAKELTSRQQQLLGRGSIAAETPQSATAAGSGAARWHDEDDYDMTGAAVGMMDPPVREKKKKKKKVEMGGDYEGGDSDGPMHADVKVKKKKSRQKAEY